MTQVTKITKSTFTFGGRSYFRGGSEDLQLGDVGEKKTPLGKPNYLAKTRSVAPDNLGKVTVSVSGPYSIDWSSFSSGQVNASIKYLNAAGAAGSFNHGAAKKYNLKLVKFSLAETPLTNLLNKHAGVARKELDDEGADGRIVSVTFVCMHGEIASQVTRSGSVDVSAPVGGTGLVVGVGGGGSSTSGGTIVLPPGTCFAYGLHKVKKWVKRSGERFVDDMEDDLVGLT